MSEVDKKFGAAELIIVFQALASRFDSESVFLCALDGEIGDGDHGTTMATGFSAVAKACNRIKASEASLADVLQLGAQSFLDEVGATVGPLYAAAFNHAGTQFGARSEIDFSETLQLFTYFAEGIQTLGEAEIGDKTMVDVWIPVSNAAKVSKDSDLCMDQIFDSISETSKRAASATRTLIASKGRAARLGERSLGHMDPGAVSASIIVETVATTLKRQVTGK